ncbi:hypothetical protein EGH25_11710 [Haladaptatus sp. F3-133]|jgi:dolichol kinase|uniref:Dolichol kinase n=1 Tax=Halorutilus salinus TaxID=2487751 RepID=A0A9Q4C6D7_9EURY|nr:hypothetical protein [Halorutilus salinus]MCX2820015.1 hypothetical protein [Halorutilus salinus]
MSLVETLGDRMSEEESIARRGVHSVSSVVGLAYVIGLLQWNEVQILTGVGFAVIVLLEFDRLVLGNSLLDPLYRDYEQESPAGYAYAISGMFLAVILFEPPIAVAAVFVLSFADPVVGLISPNELLRVKPVSILVAMFVASSVVILGTGALLPDALNAVSPVDAPLGNEFPPIELSYAQAVAGGIGATFADGVKFRVAGDKPIEPVEPGMEVKGYVVDDNVTIPLYSGVLMTAVALV